jgi:hypothetical protein
MRFRHQAYKAKNQIPENQNGNVMLSLRQSFKPGEITPELAHEIMNKLAEQFLGNKYQYVVATHVDTGCVHSHVMMNYISDDLKKWVNPYLSSYAFQQASDKLCKEYGLSVLPPCKGGGDRKYSKRKATCFRKIIQNDIDRILPYVASYEEFLQELSENYYVKNNGKYLSVRHRENGQRRNIRVYSLGDAYRETELQRRIEDRIPQSPQSYSAKKSYIQQLFQTHSFLQAEKIESYEDLFTRIDELNRFAENAQQKIDRCEEQIALLDSITESLETYHNYKELDDEQKSAMLPERFYFTHKTELDAFHAAEELLHRHSISPAADGTSLTEEKNRYLAKLETLEQQFEQVEDQLILLNRHKRTIDDQLAKQQTISKGESPHGR